MEISDQLLFKWVSGFDAKTPTNLTEAKDVVTNYINAFQVGSHVKIKELLDTLQEHESILFLARKRYRDHVYHSCRLGISGDIILSGKINNVKKNRETKVITLVGELMKRNKSYQELFTRHSISTDGENYHRFLLGAWYVASILHDIGFVFEAYLQIRESISLFQNFRPMREFFRKIDQGLDQLEKDLQVSGLTAGSTALATSAHPSHEKIGAAFAKSLLSTEDPLLEVASRMILMHDPEHEICFSEEPLAYLMAVLDETQEWKRPLVDMASLLAVFQGEKQTTDPVTELPCISLDSDSMESFLWNIDQHDNHLCLHFMLDYNDNASDLLKTGFNFPLAIYLKQRAVSRLKVGSLETLGKVCNELLLVPSSEFDLDLKVDIIGRGNLSQEWNRQAKLLQARAKDENKKGLIDWVEALIKNPGYLFDKKAISIQPSTTWIPAGLENDMFSSFEFYLLEKEIQETKIIQHLTYQRKGKTEFIEVDDEFERHLVNRTEPHKGIPQVVTTIGDLHPAGIESYEPLVSVKIDRDPTEYKDTVTKIVLPKVGPEPIDTIAVIFNFEKLPPRRPLLDKIVIKYKHHLVVPKSDLGKDYFTNMRKHVVDSLSTEVRFEKNLFESMFIGGLTRTVHFTEWGSPHIENSISDVKRKLERGIDLPNYVPMSQAEKSGKFYVFRKEFKNIEPYTSPGWLWILK
jgi:hypothetical protein